GELTNDHLKPHPNLHSLTDVTGTLRAGQNCPHGLKEKPCLWDHTVPTFFLYTETNALWAKRRRGLLGTAPTGDGARVNSANGALMCHLHAVTIPAAGEVVKALPTAFENSAYAGNLIRVGLWKWELSAQSSFASAHATIVALLQQLERA
uniref:hypothetical protein n=1 Tax=Microvirga calopogonii TaxID=2078013 RepID=UPI00197BF5D7